MKGASETSARRHPNGPNGPNAPATSNTPKTPSGTRDQTGATRDEALDEKAKGVAPAGRGVRSPARLVRDAAVGLGSSPERALAEGRHRVVVENVAPCIDGGRFPVKRCTDEELVVEADAYGEGHDLVTAVLHHRTQGETRWTSAAMEALPNDRFRGRFATSELGRIEYCVEARVDHVRTWQRGLAKKAAAGQDVEVDLAIGAGLLRDAAARASGDDQARIERAAGALSDEETPQADRVAEAGRPELAELVDRHCDRSHATWSRPVLEVVVEPPLARHSTWYEVFPRSWAPPTGDGAPPRHGTLADVRERALPHARRLGCDVLYLPPIHPVGETHRKGPNNNVVAEPGDVGSVWAIGAKDGGHDAVHPELGTIDDVRELAAACREQGVELALDLAFQCSPDHPWVSEHPEWFRHRPDGTIQYAENPPKKYQDIYPLDFEGSAWRALWDELLRVTLFWIDQGVHVFRVDNPHTKPFRFWEWLIGTVKRDHPQVIFLSEAFTRPKVMHHLARLGFSQSYTYFTWRNTKWELEEYMKELTSEEWRDSFRPNFWPNTPDILPGMLQEGGRGAFAHRLVLAATLTASYGTYGPAFELLESAPLKPGSEEYLDSEKYEIREWELDAPWSLAPLMRRLNRIRAAHPALQRNETLRFHQADDDAILVYSKTWSDPDDAILCFVNLDPHSPRASTVRLDLQALGLSENEPFVVHDLVSDGRWRWQGSQQWVRLDPASMPAHVFTIVRDRPTASGATNGAASRGTNGAERLT